VAILLTHIPRLLKWNTIWPYPKAMAIKHNVLSHNILFICRQGQLNPYAGLYSATEFTFMTSTDHLSRWHILVVWKWCAKFAIKSVLLILKFCRTKWWMVLTKLTDGQVNLITTIDLILRCDLHLWCMVTFSKIRKFRQFFVYILK
jgi:hypothetical protein